MPAVDQGTEKFQVGSLGDIGFNHREPFLAYLMLNFCITITGKIHEAQMSIFKSDIEEIHQPGFTGSPWKSWPYSFAER